MNDPIIEAFRNVFGPHVTFDIEQEIKRATAALYDGCPFCGADRVGPWPDTCPSCRKAAERGEE